MKSLLTLLIISLVAVAGKLQAQDLDPRAYTWVPVNATVIIAGFGYSDGGIITDATLPVEDVHAVIQSPSVGLFHSFNMFGRTAQISAALPYAWGDVSGKVGGAQQSTSRSGLSDMRIRFSWLLIGAPASTLQEILKTPRKTILGTSISIMAPTGQYDPEKLINLGTSRWGFKPELAISQPLGKRWLIDFYTGLWIFTENDSFYPGSSVRKQNPLASFQGHISYNFLPLMWAAIDMTFYAGGNSTLDGAEMDDRQSNFRIGSTLVIPVGKRNSLKFAFSRGAIIRSGANFTTISAGWQTTFLGTGEKAVPVSE